MKTLLLRLISRLHRTGRLENGCIWDGHHIRVEDKIEGRSGCTYGPFLICDDCQILDTLETEPPAGHPDSMRALSDAEEALLKPYDAAFTQGAI